MTLDVTGIGAHAQALTQLSLTARMEPPHLPAYGRLLLDVMKGDPACPSVATRPRRHGGSRRPS
ncbi:hypothetical protein [Streptomyces sp. NPDC004232]|uniref:hypothetical protein n=1 Tax=unclassified Streptomyces TaxID=2593676 RepID=UPI0033B88D35